MKKTIKILSAIIIMIMLLTNIAYAIEEDTEAPVINSITMSKKNVQAGEEIKFSVNTTDNLSGTHNITIEWMLEGTDGKNENHLAIGFGNISSDIFEKSFTVPASTLAGNWQASALQIWDASGNYKCITRGIIDEIDISTLDIIIQNDNEIDTEAPKLNNIKILETNYDAPCTITIEADISDNVSETVRAQIDYGTTLPKKKDWSNAINGILYSEPEGHNCSFVFNKQETGKYQASITLENKYINLLLRQVRLEDETGNYANYTYREDELKEIYGNNNYVYLDTNIDIIPRNYQKDTTAPVLKKFLHNKTKIQTPGLLETTFELEENESGMATFNGTAYFKNADGSYNKGQTIMNAIDSDGRVLNNQFVSKLEFTRYENPGTIYLYKVVFGDKAGNNRTYLVEDGTLKKQEVKVVTDETTYTLETSNTVTNYIEQIAQLPEGSTVLCNIATNKIIKKELFDAIKGKNIKITFEDVYGYTYNSKGIQWILNGKDIVNETKDIDMTINMWVRQYCPYLLEGYKFPEFTGETEEQYKAYQIKTLTEYFNHLKKLGYKNTDKYIEKAKNILSEMQDGGYDNESLIMEVTWYTRYLSIEFADNGLLPAEFKIRIKPEYATRNIIGADNLFLFYVNGNQYEQVMENIGLAIDDYYELDISHNSEYWLTNQQIQEAEMESSDEGESGVEQEEIVEEGSEKEIIDDSVDKITDESTPKTGAKMYLTEACVILAVSTILLTVAIKVKKSKH